MRLQISYDPLRLHPKQTLKRSTKYSYLVNIFLASNEQEWKQQGPYESYIANDMDFLLMLGHLQLTLVFEAPASQTTSDR